MVVVAVRDAGTGVRAARLGLRVLLAAGFALVAWVLGALLTGSTASADEAQPVSTVPPRHSASDPKLLTGLTTTLTGLVSTADQAATKVTQAVVEPVQTAFGSAPAQPPLRPRFPASALVPVQPEPRPQETLAPTKPPAPAREPVVAAPAKTATTFPVHPAKLRGVTLVPFTQDVDRPDRGARAHQNDPAPPPMRNGDQTVVVAATHDGGGAGKHPFAVPSSWLTRADLRTRGGAVARPIRHEGRNAALPATSPD